MSRPKLLSQPDPKAHTSDTILIGDHPRLAGKPVTHPMRDMDMLALRIDTIADQTPANPPFHGTGKVTMR